MHSEKNPVNEKSTPLFLILKIVFSVGLLGWVAYKIELWKIAETLKDVQWFYLFPALLAFGASKLISSIRLNYFFRDIELRMSEWENIKLYWIGMLYNSVLPGGIGGDGYKTWYLQKYYSQISWKRIAKAIVIDRVVGLLVLCLLATVLGIVLFFHFLFLLLAGIFLAVIVYVILIYRYFPRFSKNILNTFMLSLLVQLFQLLSALFIMYALDVNVGFLSYFFLFLLSSIATIIPFTIGGAGMREMVFLYCSSWFAIDMYSGISMVFIFYLLSMAGSLPGIFHLFTPGVSASQTNEI